MANLNPKKPGNVLTFEGEGQISGNVPSAAVYAGQAWEALTQVAGNLSDKLGQLADDAAKREGEMAGLTAGQQSGEAYLQSTALTAEAAAAAGKGPWMDQAKAILRKEEGFRNTPYHDVNAHRVGYGSDTTVVNGKVVRVTPGMTITRDQAEADLTHRLTAVEGKRVMSQIGTTWDGLPDNAKAGLASVGYNYGSLPAAVVAAARTGDVAKIAAAVAALPANPGRRKREAAIILGSSAPPAGTPDPIKTGATGKDTPSAPAQLPTLPLALRRDGTIRGEAYDNAASSAYAWRLQQGFSNDIFAAHEKFQDDPQGFASALADIHAKYAADPNLSDPGMREAFDKSFAQRSEAYAQDVAARHQTRLRQEQETSFTTGLEASRVDLQRQAQVLGANPKGDEIIATQVSSLNSSIDAAVASGTITPATAAKQKQVIAETAARGRIQGVYDALPTPRAQEEFSRSILDDWRHGKGPLAKLDYETVQTLSDTLRRDAQEKINKQMAASSGDRARIQNLIEQDLTSIEKSGKPLDISTGLTPEAVQAATGDAGLVTWQQRRQLAGRVHDATTGMELQSSADIAQRLDLIKPKGTGPTAADDQKVYDAAVERAKTVLEERKTDPLGQAARAGAIEVKPLDPTDANTLADSLRARQQAQIAVSGIYGQPAPFFRPGEKEALSATLATNPAALSTFAATITQTLGNNAVKVLGEISPDAPVLAHTAALTAITGSNAVADEVSATLVMKQKKMLTAKMPPEGDMGTFAAQSMGGALSGNTEARSAIVQTANILYESMANTYGFDATDLKTSGSPAQVAYRQALDRAAGGRTVNGISYGGLGEINGSQVVIPPDMEKNEPDRILSNLTDDQLKSLPPIASMSGYPVSASQIRNAYVVSAGNGRYRFALNDPQSPEPRYLAGPDGRTWSLDIHQLKDIQAKQPNSGFQINPFGWNIQR